MTDLNEKALRGLAAIDDMLGAESAKAIKDAATSDQFGAALSRLALEFAFADNWTAGDTLTRRERSLLIIAVLIALRQPEELKNHVRLGLRNGIAPDELEKILLHLVPYVGFPATATASAAMRDVLKNTYKAKAGKPPKP